MLSKVHLRGYSYFLVGILKFFQVHIVDYLLQVLFGFSTSAEHTSKFIPGLLFGHFHKNHFYQTCYLDICMKTHRQKLRSSTGSRQSWSVWRITKLLWSFNRHKWYTVVWAVRPNLQHLVPRHQMFGQYRAFTRKLPLHPQYIFAPRPPPKLSEGSAHGNDL